MGDTYGAWEAILPDGSRYLVVSKAYSCAKSIAERHFGKDVFLSLVGSEHKNTFYRRVLVDGEE